MSQDAGSKDPITVETDGVTVTKRFEPEEFAVPTMEFRLESERSEAVTVRLIDRIPEDFPMDGVGFHPDYGSDKWTAYKNHRVEYETVVEPDEPEVTVYGIRISEPEEATPFLSEPDVEVEAVDAEPDDDAETTSAGAEALDSTDVSDLVTEEGTGVVRDFIKGDRDTIPGMEAEASDVSADDPGIGDIDIDESELEGLLDADADVDVDVNVDAAGDPDADAAPDIAVESPDDADADELTPSDPDTGPAAVPSRTDVDSIAAALATELSAGTVSDEVVEKIRTAVAPGPDQRYETQLEHLQARVGELEAYTDAFGEFLDEHGTGEQLVTDISQDIDELETGLASLSDDVGELTTRLTDAESSLESHASDIGSLESSVGELGNRIDELVAEQSELANRLEANTDRLEASLDEHAEDADATLDDLRSDLTALEESVETLETWRAQLGEMFTD